MTSKSAMEAFWNETPCMAALTATFRPISVSPQPVLFHQDATVLAISLTLKILSLSKINWI